MTLSSPEEVARAWSGLNGKAFPKTKNAIVSFADYDQDLHETLKSAQSEYPEEEQGPPTKGEELENLASEKLAWARKLKVVELREELGKRGHDTKGLKAVLLKKLEQLIVIEAAAINDLPPPTTKEENLADARKAVNVSDVKGKAQEDQTENKDPTSERDK